MRLYLSCCAMALVAASAASAADLGRAPAPMPTVAPATVFDAYVSMAAGYSWGDPSEFASDNDGARVQGRGSFSYNFAPTYGFQGDAVFGHDWAEYSGDGFGDLEDPTTDITLASHLFWRDPRVGAFGLLAQYTGTRTTFNYEPYGGPKLNFDTDNYLLGVEGQYFIGSLSLYGQLAYHFSDINLFGSSTDGDGVAAVGQLRYFATPDWLFALKGGYDRVKFDDAGITASTWLVGLKSEYKVAGSGFSLFADVTYSDMKYDFGGFSDISDRETRAMVGFKYNFSTPSLIDRDRAGASFDPIELRGRYASVL